MELASLILFYYLGLFYHDFPAGPGFLEGGLPPVPVRMRPLGAGSSLLSLERNLPLIFFWRRFLG